VATIYLSLGSNLKDRSAYLTKAIEALKKNITIEKISTIRETEPVGGPPQGRFLNLALKARTHLSPHELLDMIHTIEQSLGRKRAMMDGPRTIDIDILLYGRLSMNTPHLIIPHPRMHQRAFVLDPLKEIEPDLFNNER
jgi:2-amino-4-hydroxy-6-hydroxymethyldihydropteridine diphosphokinase